MLCLIEGMDQFARLEFSDLKSEISNLKSQAESISRQLRGWADSLQNSGIKGQRYLDEKVRRRESAARDRQEFLRELDEIRKSGGSPVTGDKTSRPETRPTARDQARGPCCWSLATCHCSLGFATQAITKPANSQLSVKSARFTAVYEPEKPHQFQLGRSEMTPAASPTTVRNATRLA